MLKKNNKKNNKKNQKIVIMKKNLLKLKKLLQKESKEKINSIQKDIVMNTSTKMVEKYVKNIQKENK